MDFEANGNTREILKQLTNINLYIYLYIYEYEDFFKY